MEKEQTKLLLVDDSEVIHLTVKELLKELPYTIISAYDGKEAISKLGNNPVDLILTDVNMPNKDGFQFCAEVKASRFKDLPVIFLTAEGKKEDILQGLRCGANDYIIKPFEKEELVLRIETQVRILNFQKEITASEKRRHHQAMVVTLSHELNNPLTIMEGALSAIVNKKEYIEKYINMLLASNERMAEVLRKIRKMDDDFSYEEYAGGTEMLSLEDEEKG